MKLVGFIAAMRLEETNKGSLTSLSVVRFLKEGNWNYESREFVGARVCMYPATYPTLKLGIKVRIRP